MAGDSQMLAYDKAWAALNTLIREGTGFSGHERNCAYLNLGSASGRFANVSGVTGLDFDDDGRGLAHCDWDGDGDLDLWLTNRTGPRVRFLRNDSPAAGRSVSFRLRGVKGNRDAIGARLVLHLEGAPEGKSPMMHKTLRAGHGHMSQSSKWVHFGLGTATPRQVEVRWPGGGTELFPLGRDGKRFVLEEGTGRPEPAPVIAPQQFASSEPEPVPESDAGRIVLLKPAPMPRLGWTDAEGKPVQLDEIDAPVLLNLWATTCAPCVAEMSEWAEESSAFEARGLQVVAVSVDPEDVPNDELLAFVERTGLECEIGRPAGDFLESLDTMQRSFIGRQLDLPTPSSFLIDGDGRLVAIYRGPVAAEQLRADLGLMGAPAEEVLAAAVPFPGRWLGEPKTTEAKSVALKFVARGRPDLALDYAHRMIEIAKRGEGSFSTSDVIGFENLIGGIHYDLKAYDKAAEFWKKVVEQVPGDRVTRLNLARAYNADGQMDPAIEHLRIALEQRRQDPENLAHLARFVRDRGELAEAVALFRESAGLTPSRKVQMELSETLVAMGDIAGAAKVLEDLLERWRDWPPAANNLAWILSASPDEEQRDGELALRLAKVAAEASRYRRPYVLGTLAAAHAENGQFEQAAEFAAKAVDIANGAGDERAAALIQPALDAYRAGRAYRDPALAQRTQASAPATPEESHARMVASLGAIAERVPLEHPQLGAQVAEALRARLGSSPGGLTDVQRCQLHNSLGYEELKLDNIREAIAQFEAAYALSPKLAYANEADRILSVNGIRLQLGMAYMRLGETENCCQRYTAESCIVPIRGGGIHTRPEGSTAAIRYFTEILREPSPSENPADHIKTRLAAKWLLNLANMTLGQYPDGVPPEFLISPDVFESEFEFPRFRNAGPDLGMDTFNLCGAVVTEDFDGDGDLDILTSSWDPAGQTRYFRNDLDGGFTDATEGAGLLGLYGGLHMNQADYDNDGDVDVFIYRGAWGKAYGRHPNSLLRNDGAGRFTDVTLLAGLGDVHYPTHTGAWADYDNDGDLDLFVGNETTADLQAPCQLFRNNGDGTFTDVAGQAGVDCYVFSKGVAWGDIDGDRYPDLFVSNGGGPNKLFHNNGDGTFTDIASEAGVATPTDSFPTWFWDYDNDGALDLWVGVSSGPIGVLALFPEGVGTAAGDAATRKLQEAADVEIMALYRGDGKGGFRDVAREVGLDYPAQPMGCNFGDLDNDGFLDFYLGTGDVAYTELRPNVMFLNRGGEQFSNVTMAGGFGHLQKGHGVSFVDIDHDGDNDVYIQLGGAYAGDRFNDALFENPGFSNRSIAIELEGRRSNRSAIGARIRLVVSGPGGERSIYRHVDSGSSFGCNPLRQTIGFGSGAGIDRIEIFWPTTGHTQVVEAPPADVSALRIIEGEPGYRALDLVRFELPSSGGG